MLSLKTLYYRIWTDAIRAAIKHNREQDWDWKLTLLLTFSVAQGTKILALFFYVFKVILEIDLKIFIEFDFLPITRLNYFLSSFITLYLPFLLLNYFLIFHKNKYKMILDKYQGFRIKQGLAFMLYFFISMAIFVLPLVIIIIIN